MRHSSSLFLVKQPEITGVQVLLFLTVLLSVWLQVVPSLQAEERVINLEIEARQLTASDNTFRLTQGDQVTLIWKADEDVDLHLHGYDLKATVTQQTPLTMTFTAHTAGRFPLSAHNFGHATLLYLEIYPD
ncbi:hypothetical protein ACTL6U_09190 [Rhodovibrionaceae bacterium A322]